MFYLIGKAPLTGEGPWEEKRWLRAGSGFQGQDQEVRVTFDFPVCCPAQGLGNREPARTHCRNPHQEDGSEGLKFSCVHFQGVRGGGRLKRLRSQ